MNNMDENLQQSFIYNSSDIETGAIQEYSNTSCNFTTFNLQILNYLKFYYFSPNDLKFYLVICKIILQDSFNDHNHNDHEFFYQHPSYPSIRYHVTCKLLPYSLVENVLNNELCGMNFDIELLSLDQKFNLEHNLKQKLYYRMLCENTNSFHNDVRNHEMRTQTVSSIADNQNNNDSDLPSNHDHITHQNTNGSTTKTLTK